MLKKCTFIALFCLAPPILSQWTISNWRQTEPLPEPPGITSAVSYGDHIIVVAGGKAWVGDVDVTTGDVVIWRSTLAPPSGHPASIYTDVAARVDKWLILPSGTSSLVAELDSDGSILNWNSAPGLSGARFVSGTGAAAVHENRIYVAGGHTFAPHTAMNAVEMATIAANGTLSSWSIVSTMPAILHDPVAAVYGERLYVFGGEGTSPGASLVNSKEFRSASISPGGALGSWQSHGTMAEPRSHSEHLLAADTIHVVGGAVHSFFATTTESVLLSAAGIGSGFFTSAPLPTLLSLHASAVVGPWGFIFGGANSNGTLISDVYVAQVAQLNQPPIAVCIDSIVDADDSTCTADASIDGGSFDPDGDQIEILQTPGGPYNLGSLDVLLEVSDGSAMDSCVGTVTLLDSSPPTISNATASPSVLWPPNHKLKTVNLSLDTFEACSTAWCSIVDITSNEPINGPGDGNTSPDWEITGALTVKLRAERAGGGTGRVYTVHLSCTDEVGNAEPTTISVVVPHSQ